MKSSVFYYCALLFVVLSGVLFGLDWQSAPMSPMPEIKVVAFAPPPPLPTASPVKAAAPTSPSPSLLSPSLTAPANTIAPQMVPPAPVVQTPPKPLCDVAACAAAYRSFRESDCTYNPSVGPRQLCTKGVVPAAAATAPNVPPPIVVTEPAAQPDTQPDVKCNVNACAAAYRSFRESDCTFNPSVGPRQLCKK